jgi:Do/DeqQ family serine protease
MRSILILALVSLAATSVAAEETIPPSREAIAMSFAPIVREAAPAVVNIYASRIVAERVSPFAFDPFFRDFFSGFDQTVSRIQNSLGSGVIVDAGGIVVSNHHVVGDATEIRVVLADRREFSGRILLSDADADLAVIRLEGAADLPVLEFADSESVEVGDLVLAIGNPFGVGQTVTSGIISGLARSMRVGGRATGYYLQTDAAINPGNSGGALVDMQGRLLGINTAILSGSGGSQGVGFAIPASIVRQYVTQAEAGQDRFIGPWSGVAVQPVDAGLAQAMGLDRPEGVLITQLHPASPFAAAGMTTGDLILSVGGQPVGSGAELEARLTALGVGAEAEIVWRREEETARTTIALIAAPGAESVIVRVGGATPFQGITLSDLSPRLIEDLNLPLDAEGVVVVSTSATVGRGALQAGDILLSVNGQAVAAAEHVAARLSEPAPEWEIVLLRDGRQVLLRLR